MADVLPTIYRNFTIRSDQFAVEFLPRDRSGFALKTANQP